MIDLINFVWGNFDYMRIEKFLKKIIIDFGGFGIENFKCDFG